MSGMRFGPQLRFGPGRKPTIFNPYYNSVHRINPITKSIINDPAHPRHFKLQRQYEKRDRNGLWWSPQVTLAISPKRTVRTWCTRRLRTAFKEELAARGLNDVGQRVRDGVVVQGRAPIVGSLSLQAQQSVITAKYIQLRQEAGWLVDALLACSQQQPQKSATGGGRQQQPQKSATAGGWQQRQGNRPPATGPGRPSGPSQGRGPPPQGRGQPSQGRGQPSQGRGPPTQGRGQPSHKKQ